MLLPMRRTILLLALALPLCARAQYGPPVHLNPNAQWGVHALCVFDADGDGDLDMVSGADDEILMSRNNGNGLFGLPEVLPLSLSDRWYLGAHDLDQDGDLDLLQAGQAADSATLWLANDGTGHFQPAGLLDGGITEGDVVTVLDFDSDGDPDVLRGYFSSTHIHLNNGAGVFAPSIALTGDLGQGRAVDLDLDGDLDLVGEYGSFTTNTVMRLDTGSAYGAQQNLGGAIHSDHEVLAFDVDMDGDTDVVSVVPTQTDVFLNDGTATFAAPLSVSTIFFAMSSVQVADITGSPLPDLVACSASGSLCVMTNLGGGSFAPPLLLATAPTNVRALNVADIDGDGLLDLSSIQDGSFIWHANDGGGTFGPPRMMVPDRTSGHMPSHGDMDGDGDKDLLMGNCWLEQTSPTSSMRVHPIDVRLHAQKAADMNGDGLMDTYSAATQGLFGDSLALALNTGGPVFQMDNWADGSFQVFGMFAEDFDADGDLDLLRASEYLIHVYLNDGTGEFTQTPTFAGNNNQIGHAAVADFDGDGDADVACNAYSSTSLAVHENPGNGDFTSLITHVIGVFNPFVDFVQAHDLDTDGDPDVLFSVDNTLHWYANNGIGNAWTPHTITNDLDDWNSKIVFDAGDVDGDGDLDLLYLTDNDRALHLRYNFGAGAFGAAVPFGLDSAGYVPTFFDLEGDGDADLLVWDYFTYNAWLYINYAINPYSARGTVFADANGDGIMNGADAGLPWLGVAFDPGQGHVFTQPDGSYDLRAVPGDYEVSTSDPGAFWSLSTDSLSYHFTFSDITPEHDSLHFGFVPVADTSLLLTTFTSAGSRCNDTIPQWVSVANQGTRVEDVLLHVELDSLMTLVAADPPADSTVGNSSYWHLDSLSWFEVRTIALRTLMPSVDEIGSVLQAHATAIALDSIGQPLLAFTGPWSDTVTCAFDPNDKQVIPVGYGSFGAVDISTPWFTYTIRFQNTGTDTARTVVLVDQLDPDLAHTSLQVLGFSHQLTGISIDAAGEATFRFDDILLPDSAADQLGSQGFLTFRIAPQPGLPHATAITNSAGIHFDLNPPILTNTTVNTLVDCSLFSAGIFEVAPWTLEATVGIAHQWFLDGVEISGATGDQLTVTATGYYTVMITSAYGCTALSDPLLVSDVAVTESDALAPIVIPNPFTQRTRVILNTTLSSLDQVVLVDLHGRVLRTYQGSGLREVLIERGDLPAGIHVLRILRDGVAMSSVRVVLQ